MYNPTTLFVTNNGADVLRSAMGISPLFSILSYHFSRRICHAVFPALSSWLDFFCNDSVRLTFSARTLNVRHAKDGRCLV